MSAQQEEILEKDLTELIQHLLTRQISAFLIIFGRRGAGKTDFALLIAEIAYKLLGFKHISTNVKIHSSPFPITEVTNLDDLQKWATENPGMKLFILDEVAKTMPRRKPMASLTVELLNEFQVIRKHKLSIVCTTITDAQTDSGVLDPSIIDGYFIKTNFANPKVAQYYDYLEPIDTPLNDIPRTEVSYDTYNSALFTKHGKDSKPKFKEDDESKLWDWSHGATGKDIGLHPQQLNRLCKKFIKEILESKHHTSQ